MQLKDGQYVYTVEELIDELKDYPKDSLVFMIGHVGKKFFEKPFYKIEQAATEDEIFLFGGNDVIPRGRNEERGLKHQPTKQSAVTGSTEPSTQICDK